MMKFFSALLILLVVSARLSAAEKDITFEKQVRPILKAHCFECHGEGAKLKGNLDLRLKRLLTDGGKSGPAIVPGDVKKSLLIERVRSEEMPPGKRKLTRDEISVLERWIA